MSRQIDLFRAMMTFGGGKDLPKDYSVSFLPNVPGVGRDYGVTVYPSDDSERESSSDEQSLSEKKKKAKLRAVLIKSLMNK